MAFKLLLLVGADIPKREKNFSGSLLKSIFDTGHIIWTLYKPDKGKLREDWFAGPA